MTRTSADVGRTFYACHLVRNTGAIYLI